MGCTNANLAMMSRGYQCEEEAVGYVCSYFFCACKAVLLVEPKGSQEVEVEPPGPDGSEFSPPAITHHTMPAADRIGGSIVVQSLLTHHSLVFELVGESYTRPG